MPQEMIKAFFNCLPNYCTRCGAWHDDGTVELCMDCLDDEETKKDGETDESKT